MGRGDGQAGDSVDDGSGDGPGGDQEGRHILEVEVSLDELADILGEELQLPRIEPKGKHRITSERDRYSGMRLAGPESLSHRELVERAARVLGREVSFRSIPRALALAFAWLAERASANPPLTPAMLGVLDHDDDVDPGPACRALGIELTALDAALRIGLGEEEEAA